MDKVIGSGKSLEAAISDGATKLGVTVQEVDYVVVTKGGFLRSFKVEVTKKPSEGETYKDFLQNVLKLAEFDLSVDLQEDEENIFLTIDGKDTSSVIGYRGDVLDSLQFLTSVISKGNGKKHLSLDCENYRQKRCQSLQKLALNLEQKVIRTGRRVKLEAMNSYERRVLHSALKDSTNVVTHSEGTEPHRFVVFEPSDQLKNQKFKQRNQREGSDREGFKKEGYGNRYGDNKRQSNGYNKSNFNGGRKSGYGQNSAKTYNENPSVDEESTTETATIEQNSVEAKPQTKRKQLNFVYRTKPKKPYEK